MPAFFFPIFSVLTSKVCILPAQGLRSSVNEKVLKEWPSTGPAVPLIVRRPAILISENVFSAHVRHSR